jgi:hypothetical protein
MYYEEARLQHENQNVSRKIIENVLKAAYINELEALLAKNNKIILKKSTFYQYALLVGLLSVLPYLICFGFYISNRKNFETEIVAVACNKIVNCNL